VKILLDSYMSSKALTAIARGYILIRMCVYVYVCVCVRAYACVV